MIPAMAYSIGSSYSHSDAFVKPHSRMKNVITMTTYNKSNMVTSERMIQGRMSLLSRLKQYLPGAGKLRR